MSVVAEGRGSEFARLLEELDGLSRRDDRLKAFLFRTLRAVEALAETLPGSAMLAAVAEGSDVSVLISALLNEEALTQLVNSPIAAAKLRGLAARTELLSQEGGVWNASQVAQHLGISRQGVDKRIKSGKLLAIDTGKHGRSLPAWQFPKGGTLFGLEETLDALSEQDDWMKLSFFLSPNQLLEGARPLDLLSAERNLEFVLRAARLNGTHGAG